MTSPLLAITGSSGFLGQAVARAALDRGWRVRGLDLRPPPADADWESLRGSVTDPVATTALCADATHLVHTAAVIREDGLDSLFDKVNVHGTRTVAHAAVEAGVSHFVHISSVMVYGFLFPPNVAEDGPLQHHDNPYCRTKIESEHVLRQLHAAGALPLTILRPGDVWGPDSEPWVVRPLTLMKKRLFVLPGGGRGVLNPVWIDSLVDAIFLALTHPPEGRTFNVTDGHTIPCLAYFQRLGSLVGRRIPTLPGSVLSSSFALIGGVCRAIGREPPASPAAVRFLLRPHSYSSERIRRELGHRPTVTLDEGFKRIAHWIASEPRALGPQPHRSP